MDISKIEWFCEDNFLEFLTEHWDFIKNPEEIVELLACNEDHIKSTRAPCSHFFYWEYDVNMEPFHYRCLYKRYNDIPITDRVSLNDLRNNSFNESAWQIIEDMSIKIKANIKMTGSWESSLK